MRKLTLAALAIAAIVAGCGSSAAPAGSAPPNVKADLQNLFDQKGPFATKVNNCVHQQGNQYVCQVTLINGKQEFADVTDDGKYVYEQGVG